MKHTEALVKVSEHSPTPCGHAPALATPQCTTEDCHDKGPGKQ